MGTDISSGSWGGGAGRNTIIIIMEICKTPNRWFKALNKHNITDNAHRDGKCYQQFNRKLTHNVDINKGSTITM